MQSAPPARNHVLRRCKPGFVWICNSASPDSVTGVKEVTARTCTTDRSANRQLLQHWPELDAIQRRDLLAEVRKRMHLLKKAKPT